MQLLLISSSKVDDGAYLETAKAHLATHFDGCNNLVFIPYAGVTIRWDDYTAKVQQALPGLPISGVHQNVDAKQAIKAADGVLVGGGNTFQLLKTLYQQELVAIIQEKVKSGMPYAGWSAGSNIAGASIRTTNDMPIVEPPSFEALRLLPCQINPHYSNYQAPGHNGETRDDRLAEFMLLNPEMPVLAIPEGTALLRQGNELTLLGKQNGFLFSAGNKSELALGADLSHLL